MNKSEYSNAEFLLEKIREADAVLVGAASGLSAADGRRFWYEDDEEFRKVFGPFRDKYGVRSAFDAFYYPCRTENERWALNATLIHHLYETKAGQVYKDLKVLLQDKPCHIMTTNQDFLFFQDFPADKISTIQGDWRYFQRQDGGRIDRIWDNRKMVDEMYAHLTEGGTWLPDEYIPRDPEDGKSLMPWVRHPGFLEKSMYNRQYEMIRNFLDRWKGKKILFLELGAGRMTPMFIQEPFWQLTCQLPFAYYISINPKDALLPEVLENKGRAIHEGIAEVFRDAVELKEKEQKEDRQ
ncbi:hypothetical protein [Faecalibaculum rodentium]|uniref:hypothetical protein n=1 Tax=Faecalibaculum rodentium TaxID=1702221 RepID=UPI00258743D2|nr:hypothetical protein [Faecalibaculum rodentium]